MLGSLAKKKKKSSWKKFYHPKTARIEQQMLSEKVIVFIHVDTLSSKYFWRG